MGHRLSKIYTRTGDDGFTHLGDGNRLHKNHPRIELLGTLDELNSAIGLMLAYKPTTDSVATLLQSVQHELFNLGGELCPPYHTVITPDKVTALEQQIDHWNTMLAPLKEFILPGGNLQTASCHLARTICRRAERCAATLHDIETINPEMLRYLNRLSDVLFVAARIVAKETACEEILWEHDKNGPVQ